MASDTSVELDYRPSYLAAAITALAVLVLYLVTLAPSTAMWDTSEYIARRTSSASRTRRAIRSSSSSGGPSRSSRSAG